MIDPGTSDAPLGDATVTHAPGWAARLRAAWSALAARRVSGGRGRLNLALQGGGAHGAFTWGVLDALLGDEDLLFEGLSGSSAGAMNAVVLAEGWRKGGRAGARQALADFWTELGQQLPWSLLTQGEGEAIRLSPASQWLASWAGHFSPAQLNPMALNPLRELLVRQINFEQLRAHSPFKLFVGATQVRTGQLRVFRESELTADVLLASACLPKLHHTVEIDGEPYWDGGYSANPAVFPLFHDCDAGDVLLVLLSPLRREETPGTVAQIEARVAELAFSTHFLREMQMFARASARARHGWPALGRLERRLRQMRFHMVDTSELVSLQRGETRLLAHGPFLQLLRAQGQQRGAAWLATHREALGRRSSIDVTRCFG